MDYLIKEEKLIIQYNPGKGAWTYHLKIPGTKNIKSKWGYLKVSGFIDDYAIEAKNLMSIKGSDKLLSINSAIRKHINKSGGDTVVVTLSVDTPYKVQDTTHIIECFKDADVLQAFESLTSEEQNDILQSIISQPTEDQQVASILKTIEKLS